MAESAVTASYYADFEPLCNWQREEGHVTLVVHLPDFKIEQLKAHIIEHRMLKISGERTLEGARKSRFCKQIGIPNDCNANEIHAEFTRGRLHVTMPRKNAQKPAGDEEPRKSSRKVMIMSGVAAVVATLVLALGACVTYRCRNSPAGTSSR